MGKTAGNSGGAHAKDSTILVVAEQQNSTTREIVPQGMITRGEVAKLTGLSVPTVIRREKEGVLSPRLVNGVHYFDEQVVRRTVTTLKHRVAVSSLGATAGDVAADVFSDLDDGLSPIEIVKRRRYAPDVVKALVAQRADFRGELVISAGDVEWLCDATGAEPQGLAFKLRSELTRLHVTGPEPQGKPPTCIICRKNERAKFCAACLDAEATHFEYQTLDGVDHVRVANEVDGSTTYSVWAPPLPASAPPYGHVNTRIRRSK